MTRNGAVAVELPFVGRDRELELLQSLVSAPDRAPAAVEVTGPAGIGKTRLVREHLANHSTTTVVWESCRRSAQFGPWLRVARQVSGRSTGTLAQIVLGDDTFAASRSDLVEATVEFFRAVAVDRPLTIVLDDLHDADADTLLLTRHLAAQIDHRSLTLIVTVRAEAGEPAMIPGAAKLMLDGLDIAAVQRLLGHADVAERFRAHTNGNPLHLERLLRRESIGAADAPLTELLVRQVDELSSDEHALLLALAVLDRPTDRSAASIVSGLSVRAIERAATALQSAGLVDGTGSLNDLLVLHHGLIGAVVVEQSERDNVQNTHRRAADVLVDVPGSSDLRSQHLLATLAENSDDVVREHLAAGQRATLALAADEAAHQFREAATVLSRQRAPSALLVIDVQLALTKALSRVHDPDGSRAALDAAWSTAIELGEPSAIARSALGDDFRFGFSGELGVDRGRRCEVALQHEGELPADVRAQLHAALACHTLGHLASDRARQHATTAMALAEDSGDDYSVGCALVAWIVTDLDPDTLDERLVAARRLSSLAESCAAVDLARNAHFLLMACLLERGDVRAVDAELASRHRRSSTFAELENGRHAAWFRCMRALLDGRIDDAENLSLVALEAAQREGDPDALPVHVGQLGIIRWLQGREAEVEPFYAAARAEQPSDAVWSTVLARLWALHDRSDAARGALDALGDLSGVTRDRNWLITMATAAEAAALVGHTAALATLREMLLPYAGRLVPIGLGIACWGTVARPLALVCRALGRSAEAEHFLRSAIRACSSAGAQPWIAQAQLDLAELLRDTDPLSIEASSLTTSALATARALSIVPLRDAAESAMAARAIDIDEPHSTGQHTTSGAPMIRVLGSFAVVGANGEPASWTSRKARELLKLLVARLGRVLPRDQAIDTLWPGAHTAEATNRLSVALSTIRRALDPTREHPADAFIAADRDGITLRPDAVIVDLVTFRGRARDLETHLRGMNQSGIDPDQLRSVLDTYAGEAFADEPFADWATSVRDSTRSVFIMIAHRLVEASQVAGDDLAVIETCGKLLEADPFDEPAHLAMIGSLEKLGAHGRAAHARSVYRGRLAELGLELNSA